MFLRLTIDQTVSLHDADDLQRLHVEVAGLHRYALTAAVRRHKLGRVRDDGDLDLLVTLLIQLSGDRDPHWHRNFAEMHSVAAGQGYMTDGEHVRAHLIRIPAVPA